MTDSAVSSPPLSPSGAAPPAESHALDALHAFVERHPRLFVLTGAGISTDSGIPGYRDRNGAWMRSQPIQYREFLESDHARRRYWARSMLGWPVVGRAQPNASHHALASLGAAGRIARLVTQNVDGLHQRAGSADVVELHGGIGGVTCLDCGAHHARAAIQHILEADNPALLDAEAEPAADGDAHLEWRALDTFRVPACPACGGLLKPAVVFFGENVPRERVAAAARSLEEADAMLVAGSSLMVYSGYRFCVWADDQRKPIAAINLGHTRADPLLTLKVEASCGQTLAALAARLGLAASGARDARGSPHV
ncbi:MULTISPECIES: NAD-dependent protein deacetylase [Burkholderia]|uniref:NAD-dependent protein deacetylase n=1 Tax=Burkholderia TaxID=32008 RepID=UPI000753A1C6|nr:MULTISPECIES: NAD-dependent protein deacetylase [Burkholderia]AOJ71051.1 NAD-dependent deacetylase [Burkholderia savannae]KVG48885.1 NAD-dependent deacetylase [Burkholderia sp. MSMB0265]KVG86345.1 NAD-dependent deacetylase [Burkholderia sp. MSMB2040]KVG90623.1 NAD-dependent deacetylase [Burkholderia sp. MSMB2041]KVH00277.1 NAD-dependent deacetylase [Burkholderia sp. MSMB2042]